MDKFFKYIFSSVLVAALLAFGVNNLPTETTQNEAPISARSTEASSEDYSTFIDDYYSVYVDLRLAINQFWINYYSPSYASLRQDTDIPVMNTLGEISLNDFKIKDLENRLKAIEDNPARSHFEESFRLLSLAYSFEVEFFEGSSNLTDFPEFTGKVFPKQNAFMETIAAIQPALTADYQRLLDDGVVPDTTTLIVTIVEWSADEAVANLLTEASSLTGDMGDHSIKRKINPEEVAFINLSNNSSGLTRSSNNAYYVYGRTSANCNKVIVDTENGGVKIDSYQLAEYSYGDTTFRYGIREDWNNLQSGENNYTFTAYCDSNQSVTDTVSLVYTISATSSYPPSGYNASASDTYTNVDGDQIRSPGYYDSQPSGASATCKDGTYSFSRHRSGTCSGHGGVAQWL